MLLIGENIHIISKKIKIALEERNKSDILNLVEIQKKLDYIDLNVGPSKGKLEGILPWLCELVEANSDLKISFDTTNLSEMKSGLNASKNPSLILLNSTSADAEKLENLTSLAKEFNTKLIALTMNKEIGIPNTADERLALAFEIMEKCEEKGISNEKIFFDPLILPVSVAQEQAKEAINTIQMIKESFEPRVMTTVGLSNISNGSPKEIRPLINKVFAILAYGAGLDSAIVDALDIDLINTIKLLESNTPSNKLEELYIKLSDMIRNFDELENIEYDKSDIEQENIIKTARILLNKEVYTHSFSNI